MEKGSIVRRRNGWTPMVVVAVLHDIKRVVRYCGSKDALASCEDYDQELLCSDLVLVTNPIKEFAKCPDWEKRLTTHQKWVLYDQRMATQWAEDARKQHFGPNAGTEEPITEEGNDDMTRKLYQTKDEPPRFGTLLAVNGAGKLVLDMRGTGETLIFDKGDVEEVRPYTVLVGGPSNGSVHRQCLKGSVEVGDVLLETQGRNHILSVVEKLDTGAGNAPWLVARKVMTEALPVVESGVSVVDEED